MKKINMMILLLLLSAGFLQAAGPGNVGSGLMMWLEYECRIQWQIDTSGFLEWCINW